MEPLAVTLRSSSELEGIRVGNIHECLALYVDDLLLLLNNLGNSLRAALKIMNDFTTFSGLEVNWMKSFILPMGSRGAGVTGLEEILPS